MRRKIFKRAALACIILAAVLNVLGMGMLRVRSQATVKISKSAITMVKGKKYKLKMSGTTATPTWSSSKTSVATVTSAGTVTAKKAGTATITAKIGKKSYTCKVTVVTAKLNETTKTLNVGSSFLLQVSGTGQVTKWKTSDKAIATVTRKGKVTGHKAGKATISAVIGVSKLTCKVTVKAPAPTGVTLNTTSKTLTEGSSYTLKATVAPSGASQEVTWSSSKTSVAKVSSAGKVTAVNAGTATITAETSNSKTATCKITVKAKEIAVTGVTLNKTSISGEVGDTFTLTATVAPENATDKEVIWISSDDDVVTISGGKIKLEAEGTASITAKAGGKSAKCSVTVKEAPKTIAVTGVTLSPKTLTGEVGGTAVLTATVSPSNATNKTVTWKSSNTSVATVSSAGTVSFKGAGTASITATADGKSATCSVTVNAKSKFAFDDPNIELWENESKLTALRLVEGTADRKTYDGITWDVSNPSVVSIDATRGNVTVKALKAGTAVVTATPQTGGPVKMTVTVKAVQAQYTYELKILNNPKYHLYVYTDADNSDVWCHVMFFLKTNNPDPSTILIKNDPSSNCGYVANPCYADVRGLENAGQYAVAKPVDGGYFIEYTYTMVGHQTMNIAEITPSGQSLLVANRSFDILDGNNAYAEWRQSVLKSIITPGMTNDEKRIAVANYIRNNFSYLWHTEGSPLTRKILMFTSDVGPVWERKILECATATDVARKLFADLGYQTKEVATQTLPGIDYENHVYPEVYYDGEWHGCEPTPDSSKSVVTFQWSYVND